MVPKGLSVTLKTLNFSCIMRKPHENLYIFTIYIYIYIYRQNSKKVQLEFQMRVQFYTMCLKLFVGPK